MANQATRRESGAERRSPIQRALSGRKLIVPVVLGMAAAAWLLWSGMDDPVRDPATGEMTTTRGLLNGFSWTARASVALLAVAGCVVLRDWAYMVRIRVLAMGTFRWRQAFDTILLWELASALTPSVIGGSAVAILILRREGMTTGRSIATVFVTALMDELFYIVTVPVVLGMVWVSGAWDGPIFPSSSLWGGLPVPWLFGAAYALIACLTTLIVLGVLVAPRWTSNRVRRAFRWRLLARWEAAGRQWADDLVTASEAMRGAGWQLWAQAMGATVVSWLARFLTLNMILLIFLESVPHAAVLFRQLILWLVLMISPTPGSAGFAEVALPAFLGDVVGFGYLAVVAVIWRLVTYFPYLFAGSLVLPGWLSRTRRGKHD